ncbi:MAG: hypothetical protein J5699_00830 [Bacteroidales bacterium]|nr:hypothetical protein [Bacteroidales bacterium]
MNYDMRGYQYNKQQPLNVEGLNMPDTRRLESQVLIDLIYTPGLLTIARNGLDSSMFTVEEYRKIWTVLNDMFDKGDTIDLSTVQPKIDTASFTEFVRLEPGYTDTQIRDHFAALAEMATRRFIFSRAYEILLKSSDPGSDYGRVISMPGELLEDLSSKTRTRATTQAVKDVLFDYSFALQNQANGMISKIPTGFHNLDETIIGGWSNGSLTILAARPSVGKSAVMLQMAVEASRKGFPATVYSLEMPNRDLGQRLVLSTGVVRQSDIANDAAVQAMDMEKLQRACNIFDGLPLWFNTRLRTMDEICNDIMLQHQRGRCSIAFVDHLHIISDTNSRLTAYQVLTERTRRFKTLAMDCGIPIVVLCQLNRLSDAEGRPPELRDLRDSGSIEQDADIVLMLCRHNGNDLKDPNVDLWVRKNRNGRTGICIDLVGDTRRGFTVFSERSGLDG